MQSHIARIMSEANNNNKKSQSSVRWVFLFLICLMCAGFSYCLDIPAALKNQMKLHMMDTDEKTFEVYFALLYSLYALPNIVLPFVGGYFVDRLGVVKCLFIFNGFVIIGQLVFAFGLTLRSWPLIFLGRLIFALGGENLSVAFSVLLSDWFKGKELAFAFGINLSSTRIFSVINNVLSPSLASSVNFLFAFWFGAIVCIFSFIIVLIGVPIDRAFDLKTSKSQATIDNETKASSASATKTTTTTTTSDRHGRAGVFFNALFGVFKTVLSFPTIYWLMIIMNFLVYGCIFPFNNISSSLLLERDYFVAAPLGCELKFVGQCANATNYPIDCPASLFFQPPLPIDVTVGGVYYAGQLRMEDVNCEEGVWKDGCSVEYCKRLVAGEQEAAYVMSIPYIITGVLRYK